jgi:SpoIID/LytB domain protein
MVFSKLGQVTLAATAVLSSWISPALASAGTNSNPTLQIGILQRFGSQPQDTVQLIAPPGSMLTLQLTDANGTQQTQQTPQVTIGIVNQALTTPAQVQRLILSSHLSFESAEASAREWQARGIQTELAHPEEWQVWAKRSVYAPEQQLQILLYAQQQGFVNVRPFQQTLTAVPELSWEHNSYRYHRQQLTISSNAGSMQVIAKTDSVSYDRGYAGSLRLQPNAYGTYTLVNFVPLETYLRGVVPHEIGPGAPQAAIEAQAILARTYALKNVHRFEIDRYQLCASTACQVYRGLTETTVRTDEAVLKTAGQVLTYNGELIDAVYSSTNGGVSAAFEDVWDGDPRPYLQRIVDNPSQAAQRLDLRQSEIFRQFISRKDGFNEAGVSRLFRWQIAQTFAQLGEQLRANQPFLGIAMPNWTEVSGLKVISRSSSGRVQALQVDLQTDTGMHSVVLEKDRIRLAFRNLYSTLFDVDPILLNDQVTGYTFVGGGFGHGVGLSQYGSYTLARLGYSAPQILNFYYPGTILAPLGSISWQHKPDAGSS